MPELPEVETSRQGIINYATDKTLKSLWLSNKALRYPYNFEPPIFVGKRCINITRRAKYLIWHFDQEKLLVHLGMSGSLRVEETSKLTKKKHDHAVFSFDGGYSVIYHDPRRFGSIMMYSGEWQKKMAKLAPEPLSSEFNSHYLINKLKQTTRPIKITLMDQSIVVGVGNIYANEVLFQLKIHPEKQSSLVTTAEAEKLVVSIKTILAAAIKQGGTTLRDFVSGNNKPGYFKQSLLVYDREGLPCVSCGKPISKMTLGQRSSFYCKVCQPCSVKS